MDSTDPACYACSVANEVRHFLSLSCSEETRHAFIAKYTDSDLCLDLALVIPPPNPDPSAEWAKAHWGTVRNVTSGKVQEREDGGEIVFTTSWTSPVPVFQVFLDEWPEIDFWIKVDDPTQEELRVGPLAKVFGLKRPDPAKLQCVLQTTFFNKETARLTCATEAAARRKAGEMISRGDVAAISIIRPKPGYMIRIFDTLNGSLPGIRELCCSEFNRVWTRSAAQAIGDERLRTHFFGDNYVMEVEEVYL